jgi:hypothetical protein
MPDPTEKARLFATQAHQRIDHRRKYSKQPYDEHLRAVAERVASISDDAEMVAAAWLHDIVEDTPVTLEEVEREFGTAVASLVRELTDVSRPGDGNRAARKAIDRGHLAVASPRAKTIKLADLCDNARDICGADARFARVYLKEMAALLEVLGEGDPRLFAEARQIHAECTARLGSLPDVAAQAMLSEEQAGQLRAVWRQMNTFTVRDLARALPSIDGNQSGGSAARIMAVRGWRVMALRQDGQVSGYVRAEDLGHGKCARARRAIEAEQILEHTAPLSAMVHVLTRHEYAFVRALGQIGGVLTREDLQKPMGRMWLFGMVTLIELQFSESLRKRWPQETWTGLLSQGRLDKARQLQEERHRRGQPVELLECLQLADKATILSADSEQLAEWGYRSKRAAQADFRETESLRNHLTHSQDVVNHHWHQIARMTRRFEEALMEYAGPAHALPRPASG